MIFPLHQEVEWNIICQWKQKMIDKNNEAENNRRIDYDYQVDDLVLLTSTNIQQKLDTPTKDPFPIEKSTQMVRCHSVEEPLPKG